MYDVSFASSIQNLDDLHIQVSKAYDIANIPQFYPAAHQSIQSRLQRFVDQGLGDELIRTFDKINSNRTYQLEKDSDDKVSLMVHIRKGKKPGKYLVLTKNQEIDLVLSILVQEAKNTGRLLTAPKCHGCLKEKCDISDKRIRLIVSTVYKWIEIKPIDKNRTNGSKQLKSDTQHENLDLSSANVCYSPISTRSKRKQNSSKVKKVCANTTNNADMAINKSLPRERGSWSSKRK